jgi:beta-galactosidase
MTTHDPIYRPIPTTLPHTASATVSLNGTWDFCATPSEAFFNTSTSADPIAPIEVPGEWVMQGLEVPAGQAAGYRRIFTIPSDWKGLRVILRADAIYSDARIWINGTDAGSHLGGFTPVELDVTELLRPGDNLLAIAVRNESVADSLASGTRYAGHPLGGITRKIRLFAVPAAHITDLFVHADWDPATRNAALAFTVELTNADARPANMDGMIEIPGAPTIPLGARTLTPGESISIPLTATIPDAHPWHTEHPYLYGARLTLRRDDRPVEVIERTFGCKRVEVRGNQVIVNGKFQKLYGVNRHEVHPQRGRSLVEPMWRKDLELYRAANVNLIRTCHYPPAEELLEAADELGLFVECEGPFCWSHEYKDKFTDDDIRTATVQQTAEMGRFLRHHPSILFWSVANESDWSDHFAASSEALRRIDPTRPQTFEYVNITRQQTESEVAHCEIASTHYPGPTGPEVFRNYARPVNFGEYSHLNAYNRHELATDPGLRDAWGRDFARMVDDMRGSAGVCGGSIWAGMDDTFVLPPPRSTPDQPPRVAGYGSWGPLDAWRREKPEYWHMKKAYSPVRVVTEGVALPTTGGVVSIEVENRFLFTNLMELALEWQAGPVRGTAKADVAPGATGRVSIVLPPLPADTALQVRWISPQGFIVDESVIGRTPAARPRAGSPAADHGFRFDSTTGQIVAARIGSAEVAVSGPHLLIVPLTMEGDTWLTRHVERYPIVSTPCANWRPVAPMTTTGGVSSVQGTYDEAEGGFTYRTVAGVLEIHFAFTVLNKINPRQIGLVLDLPRDFDSLTWSRNGRWSHYPDDHIGRQHGTARAFPPDGVACNPVGPLQPPTHPWSHDILPTGCNDFVSTKHNIRHAALSGPSGALHVESDGAHHVRAWGEGDRVHLLIATYSNAGSEHFNVQYAKSGYTPLEPGAKIEGMIRLVLQRH